jgi:hypothetical protein
MPTFPDITAIKAFNVSPTMGETAKEEDHADQILDE